MATLITVGGVDLPTPSEYSVSIMDLSKAERNARGTMLIERIATKRKVSIGWNYLTGASLSNLLNSVAPAYFDITYLDPQTNTMRTGSFYCGDRSVGMIDYTNGIPRYKEIKFDLIER